MANDEWAAFRQPEAADPWASFREQKPVAPPESAPLPQAFSDRIAQGEAIKTVGDQDGKRSIFNQLTGMDGAQRYQLWPERFVRDVVGGPKDIMDSAITGPGLRKEDFSDDPNGPQPLDALIQKSTDYATKIALGESFSPGFGMTSLIPAGPLIKGMNGEVMRLSSDAQGVMRAQPVGPPPTPKDFLESVRMIGAKEAKLKELWDDMGIHPAEVVDAAQRNTFLRHDLSSAAAEPTDAPLTPLAEQPASIPGRIMQTVHAGMDRVIDLGKDIQGMLSPMTRGSRDAQAIAKDAANNLRWNRWEWSRYDTDLEKNFKPEQRTRMWEAADEESVLRQEGQQSEHMGLATLEPAERAKVEELQTRAQIAWAKARDLGMVEGEGLPSYTPRMVINSMRGSGEGTTALNGKGYNIRTRTPQMIGRKYLTAEETERAAQGKLGEDAILARDIRALPLATARMEDAIAGRTLINSIKDYGAKLHVDTVKEGVDPSSEGNRWFTMFDHPAFRTWRPKLEQAADGKWEAIKDENGDHIFEQVPIYIHGDFEGPLNAIMSHKSGKVYQSLMEVKGKAMSLIMNSPVIHNAVEWSRAFPALPGKVATTQVYWQGNAVKNNPEVMERAIKIGGLVPIGKRFFKQDITSIMEQPDLAPGRSWTAKVVGAIPGIFDAGAETATKRAIDKMGDFWHNTLLWDRIADLQMGLYKNFEEELLSKQVDPATAARAAGHMANRFAGSLPKEAMSNMATKVANMLLFSRTFTLGNMGVMKDVFVGLPQDVQAQIARDAGEGALARVNSMVKRKALSTVMLDMALGHASNSLIQSAFNVLQFDNTLDQEMKGYVDRFNKALKDVQEHPFMPTSYTNFIPSLSSTAENEPGKQDRVLIGYDKFGTGIYAKSPFGKMGGEFEGYAAPIDMLKRKLGTFARPTWEIVSNDKGFGHKVYDPNAETTGEQMQNIVNIVSTIMASQTPQGQITAFGDLVHGDGDAEVNKMKLLGPIAGFNISSGAPGGPAVGEMFRAREKHDYAVQMNLQDIKKTIQRGDLLTAYEQMDGLGIPRGLQKYYIKTTTNPSARLSAHAIRQFYQYATPEQKDRFEQFRQIDTTPTTQ